MKRDLNKDLIEGLRDSTNVEFVDNLNYATFALVNQALIDLSNKSSYIQPEKAYLTPVNEIYLHAMTSQSEYTYFLGIANTEIELNSLDKKHYFKNLWKRFVRAFKMSRKKKKKKRKDKEITPTVSVTKEKYTIDELKNDFIYYLSNLISTSSIIYEYEDHISIIGKEEFGTNVKISIYITMYDEKNGIFKMYNARKNRYYEVDLNERFKNLDKKISTCENFINVVKIYNSLYSKAYNKVPNQILIESLVFNCPDILFEHDVYQTFLNVSNYIRMTDTDALRSICNNSKSVFKEKLIVDAGAQVEFARLLRVLDNYKI